MQKKKVKSSKMKKDAKVSRKSPIKKGSNRKGATQKKQVTKISPAEHTSTITAEPEVGAAHHRNTADFIVHESHGKKVCKDCGHEKFTCPFCTWPGLVLILIAVALIAWGHPTARYLAWIFILAAILSPWLIRVINRHHG